MNGHGSAQRRRRWRRIALAGGTLLIFGILLASRPSGVSRRLETLRAAGLPTTPAELDRWYAIVPPDRNMAGPLLEAAMAFRSTTDTNLPFLGRSAPPPRGRPLPEPARSLMMAFVTSNRESLDAVHAALQRPGVRFPVNLSRGMTVLLPHLAPLKRAANALALEACVAADLGEADRAGRALRDGLRLGEAVKTEPLLISALVGMACQTITCNAAEFVLGRGLLSETQLRELQDAFHHAATSQSIERALLGDLCQIDQIRTASAGSLAAMLGSGNTTTLEESLAAARLWLYAACGLTRRDYAFTLDVLDDLRQAAGRPFPERLHQARRITENAEERLTHRYLPLARAVAPGSLGAFQTEARCVAGLECAATACAVERFRLAHTNQLPESLSNLVPAFLDAVPRDPIDGAALRYRPLTNGYVIYSVGDDGRDDGGIEFRKRSKKIADGRADSTFVVER